MSEVLVLGADDHGLAKRFEAVDVAVAHLDGQPVGADLEAAGIGGADAVVLTETSLSTLIAVAKEHNPDIAVVLYAEGRLPEFATRQADLAVDPALVTPDDLVDAVVDRIAAAS